MNTGEIEVRKLTLVCLDVVDSTRIVRGLGAVGSALLFQRHDRLTRSLIARFNGREIDKTDGFLLVFDRTVDALNFALSYQMYVPPRTKLNARIGVHVGECALSSNRLIDVEAGAKVIELDGIAKPITARIMSLADSGQILMSLDARRACEFRLNAFTPKGTEFKNVGVYMLKGVKTPVSISAVGTQIDQLRTPKNKAKVKRVKKAKKEKFKWTWRSIKGLACKTSAYVSVILFLYVSLLCLHYPFAVDLLQSYNVPAKALADVVKTIESEIEEIKVTLKTYWTE